MTDVHSKETRSYNMSRIRARNTKPEIMVRKFLFSKGFRYRINVRNLPGKPDIVLRKYRTVIFIHGCFWHGHEGYPCFVIPKTRTEWWTEKIRKNKERDQKAHEKLRQEGWALMTIWECQLKPKKRQETLEGIINLLLKKFLDIHRKQYSLPSAFPKIAESQTKYNISHGAEE